MKKLMGMVTLCGLATLLNAGMMDQVISKATEHVKAKATEKVQEKATDMAKKEAEKSLKDGSLKEKAIEKAKEVADKHTNGKASQAIDAVKSFTK